MEIKTNDNFIKILGKDFRSKISNTKKLYHNVDRDTVIYKNFEIKKIGNRYLINSQVEFFQTDVDNTDTSSELVSNKVDIDNFEKTKTSVECFYNKMYIEDFIDQELDEYSYLLQAGVFAFELADRLRNKFGGNFKIILSCSYENATISDAHVRFHKVREGEEYLDPDLNNYKIDAILMIDT